MTDIEFCPKCNNIICECSIDQHFYDKSMTHAKNYRASPTDDVADKFYAEILVGGPAPPEHVDAFPNESPIDPTICEICGAVNPKMDWFKHCAMYMCPSCRDKEMAATVKNAAFADQRVAKVRADGNKQAIENKKEREKIEAITKEIPVKGEIQVRSDIFNAQTISIIDMKKRIDEDDSITKKHFELASQLKGRFLHLREVLFNIDETRVSITSEQRSIQTYLNELSNRLRDEEREKLKIADMTYQPAISIPKTRKARKATPKFDKIELRRLASEIGVPEFTLQTICVAKGIQPVEAAKMLKGLQSS